MKGEGEGEGEGEGTMRVRMRMGSFFLRGPATIEGEERKKKGMAYPTLY